MQKNSGKYALKLRIIHWVMSLMIISMIAGGYLMTNLNPDAYPIKYTIYDWHKSFGITILILVTIRLIVRLTAHVPPLPTTFSNITKFLSHCTHFALYLLMFAMPLTGYFASSFGNRDVLLFGLKLPNLVWVDKALAGVINGLHGNFAIILIVLICLHILATFKHRYFDKQDILGRML
jgi:cytochrome b561